MDAKLYDELYRVEQSHWWFQARRHIVWSLVRRYGGSEERGARSEYVTHNSRSSFLAPRLRICELGCGTGGNLAAVADQHEVVGVECSPQALEYARRRLGKRVIRGSLPNDIDLPPDSFDVVLLTDVLEHIEDDAASARTALRLLRPGGIVVATVPAYQWLYSPRDAHHHHFRRYSKRRFRNLWRNHADITLLSHYNTLLFPAAAGVRLASKFFRPRSVPGDLKVPPAGLNRLFSLLMQSESNLLGRVPLPFGLSLIGVIRSRSVASREFRNAAA